MSTPQVRVGVGVFILKSHNEDPTNPRFLLGKRKGSHGAGTYALPGGHLEFGETWEECAVREVEEETGLKVKDLKFLTATNDYMVEEGKHYITLFMVCVRRDESIEAEVLEKDKCEGWEWCEWGELVRLVDAQQVQGRGGSESEGRRLFLPMINLVVQRPGFVPGL